MGRRVEIALFVLLFFAASMRLVTIVTQPRLSSDLGVCRNQITRMLDQKVSPLTPTHWKRLRSLGVDQLEFEKLDRDSYVVMRGGPDGQPGTAGIDDNSDGVVDDVSELGATHSDDVCQVERSETVEGHGSVEQNQAGQLGNDPVLILQRGAYVPCNWAQLRSASAGRVVVSGHFDRDRWSFIVAVAGLTAF